MCVPRIFHAGFGEGGWASSSKNKDTLIFLAGLDL